MTSCNRRSGKFYLKNEKEVMESLGLEQTKGSGSGWIEKEDGQNEFLICQLKSTDAASIRVQQKDIRVLEENAAVANKIPVFAIQFLNTGEVWLMAKPEDFADVAEYIKVGKCEKREALFGIDCGSGSASKQSQEMKVRGSKSAREEYELSKQKEMEERKKSWKRK